MRSAAEGSEGLAVEARGALGGWPDAWVAGLRAGAFFAGAAFAAFGLETVPVSADALVAFGVGAARLRGAFAGGLPGVGVGSWVRRSSSRWSAV